MLSQFLPILAPAANGNQSLNQAVDMQVGGKQHVVIVIDKANYDANGADCTVTGTVDTLQ